MIRTLHLLHLSACLSVALALNLPPLQLINITPATTPVSPANKSLSGPPTYSCLGGPVYGDSVPLASCQDAANNMLSSLPYSHLERVSFGDRSSSSRTGVMVPLPYISISSDGACAIEIVSSDPLLTDFATIQQFMEWAMDMIITCALDITEVKGGVAGHLGAYKNLGLRLTKFSSGNIACRGNSAPKIADCEALLNAMSATDLWRGFGPRGGVGVDVQLPREIAVRRKCAIFIKMSGPTDHEKWHTIWKEAAAVAKLCVSQRGKAGGAYGLGLENKKMYVELHDVARSAEERA